ncbi:MAG: hypothetical protein ACRDL6_00420 [Solirubrobacterales bacterium]
MLSSRLMAIAAVMLAASLTLAACGDDDGEETSTAVEGGGLLFAQTTGGGSLAPVQGQEDVFELTLTDPAPNVTSFTDRPTRRASTETLAEFVEQWAQRGFEDDPPNAALVVDAQPEEGDTAVFELADPRLDQGSGQVTYRATHVDEGTHALPIPDAEVLPPSNFGDAHLFIDPAATQTNDFFVRVDGGPSGGRTEITLDSQFSVFVGPGVQEATFAGGVGGGVIGGQRVRLVGSAGEIDVQVAGGSPPITGTAQIPSGANVTIEVNDGATQKISSGRFSVDG